jgi:putative ABC transport system permease protein
MFKNYILTALRNISKNRMFSAINIAGLAIGMTCSIMILMWVYHELSYDRFHPGYKRIQRMAFDLQFGETQVIGPVAMAPLAGVLMGTFPEVEDVVRIHKMENVTIGFNNENFTEPLVLAADSSFFSFFGFRLESGDPLTVLKDPFSIVITRNLAEKLFGKENPTGEKIKLYNAEEYTITGIAANPPSNSHIRFGAITSFRTLYENSPAGVMEMWMSLSYFTYIRFSRHFDRELFFAKLDNLLEEKMGENAREYGLQFTPFLQPAASVHLDSKTRFEIAETGNKASVYIFTAVAIFILLLACINFINLTTARSSQRSKEIGIRKVIGASRPQLIRQFLGEAVTLSFIAMIITIPLIEIGLPVFNSFSGTNLSFLNLENWRMLVAVPLIILVVGLLAGVYPAMVISRLNPVRSFQKQNLISSGRSWLRSGLTVFQMVVSVTLIICTIFVWQQLNFINNKDLGFEKDGRIVLTMGTNDLRSRSRVIGQELLGLPGVRNIAYSNSYPGTEFSGTGYKPDGFDEEIVGSLLDIDELYLGLMGIRLLEGRNFDPGREADNKAVLINEAAMRRYGWDEGVGKTISRLRSNRVFEDYTVIGVVSDFHFRSMHQQVEPLVIHFLTGGARYITLDLEPWVLADLGPLKSRWEEINPDAPFDFIALTESYEAYYRAERQMSRVFIFFSLLALIIAALGMYGLSCFMVENKVKEIGVKKVFGASAATIVKDFFKKFGIWLLIANIISWALAWYFINDWIASFAYRIPVGNPLPFMAAAVLSALIVLGVTGYQAAKAAYIDPARSLRYE